MSQTHGVPHESRRIVFLRPLVWAMFWALVATLGACKGGSIRSYTLNATQSDPVTGQMLCSSFKISGVALGQSFLRNTADWNADSQLKLIAAKPVSVRVNVLSTRPVSQAISGLGGNSSTFTKITVYDNSGSSSGASSGFTLAPPDSGTILSTEPSFADKFSYSFYGTLDVSQVTKATKLLISFYSIEDGGVCSVSKSVTFSASTSAQTLSVTGVPIELPASSKTSSGCGSSAIGSITDTDAVYNYLDARLPDADITLSSHATFSVTSSSGSVNACPDSWSALFKQIISELDTLRSAEGVNSIYYGIVPYTAGGSTPDISGLSYISSLVASGLDDSYSDYLRTLAHEIGHTLSLNHAPCGVSDTTTLDTSYPYSGGTLGTIWPFNFTSGELLDPTQTTDLMSYCGGTYLSDYNYKKAWAYALTQTYSNIVASANTLGVAAKALSESLLIEAQKINSEWHVASPLLFGLPPKDYAVGNSNHDVFLRVITATGQEDYAATLRPAEHLSGSAFSLSLQIPSPKERLLALEIWEAQHLVWRRLADAGSASDVPEVGNPAWIEGSQLRWNFALYPEASLVVVSASGERHAKVLRRTGGALALDATLADGAYYEVSLSHADGLGAQRLILRP